MKHPLHTYARDTKLTDRERDALRARILTYMEYHPRQYTAHKGAHLRISAHIARALMGVRGLAALGALAVLTFTTIPYFAENAQPGDLLYAVKTGVNEPLRGVALTTTSDKITFETQLLERRVAEAKLLVAEGKFDADAEERLSANIKKHSDTIQKNIEELKAVDTDNADVAQAEFMSILGTTDTIVSALTGTDTIATGTLRQVITNARTGAEQKIAPTNPIARERILGRIEQELARAYELKSSVEKELTDEETAEVARRFSEIETLLQASMPATTSMELSASSTTATSTESATTTVATSGETKVTHDYEILSRIKTLIVYLTDTSLRAKLVPDSTSDHISTSTSELNATSTPDTATSTSTSTPQE